MQLRVNYTDGEYEPVEVEAVEPTVADIASALRAMADAHEEMGEHYVVDSVETVA